MEDLDIQVGDRVTSKNNETGEIYVEIVYNKIGVENIKKISYNIEPIKIERIGASDWYTVYEKKELLTDEEKEFLKDIIKYYDNISQIAFNSNNINFCDNINYIICASDYPKNLKFGNIKKDKEYTLEELGLEKEV